MARNRKAETKTKAKKAKETVTLLHDWADFLDPPHLPQDRVAEGKQMRQDCPRNAHGTWEPAKNRPDPLALLQEQDASRVKSLIPMRYERMMQSPFAFFRGAASIMAGDMASQPRSNALVQLCGDCHLSNFGIFATPERNVIFDLNDFDETLPGPFEWDLKRLATSFVVATQQFGFNKSVASRCVKALAREYRRKIYEYSQMKSLDVWYERVDWEFLVNRISKPARRQTALNSLSKIKEKRSTTGTIAKLTEIVDGKRRIKDNPPLVYHPKNVTAQQLMKVLQEYLNSLWESRRRLIQRYHFVDVAVKVVGVGSVGTMAGIVLLQGEGGHHDQILLQLKQANPSVLEPFLGKSQFDHPGQRIVNGQRLLQSSSDLFLGWTSGPLRDFYIRQLSDMKKSVPIDELDAVTMEQYAEVCALVLARAHARTGDPAVIHGYLGTNCTFDDALGQFAFAYAEQNTKDHASLVAAVKKGSVKVK